MERQNLNISQYLWWTERDSVLIAYYDASTDKFNSVTEVKPVNLLYIQRPDKFLVPGESPERDGFTTFATSNTDGVYLGTELGGTDTTLTGLTDIDLTSGDKTIFDGVGNNTLTIGAATTSVTIAGDLTVSGNTTTLNTSTLDVEDLNITVAKGAADSAAADGAGLTVDGANATIIYDHTGTQWEFNKAIEAQQGFVDSEFDCGTYVAP